MTALAVLCGVCALVIVVLAYLVGRLQGDVRRLHGEVDRLRDEASVTTNEPAGSHRPASATEPQPAPLDVVSVGLRAERPGPDDADPSVEPPVPVITALSDGDDLDITRARVASVTLARPLIKVAAISHGFRRALRDEQRFRMRYAMRQELRRQTKMRRRRRAREAPSKGWLS